MTPPWGTPCFPVRLEHLPEHVQHGAVPDSFGHLLEQQVMPHRIEEGP